MKLSYVVITYNRRDALLASLEQVEEHTPLPRGAYEIIVVDNASTDGTAEALAQRYPHVVVLRLPQNLGMPARNHGINAASGEYVVILDDDSYPVGDTVARSMEYLDVHPKVAAVCGRVELPDGRREASAMPAVMIGCGTCLRRSTLVELGGFTPDFFRQAEEYDLTFRLFNAGYRTARFEDLLYRHDKQPGGRCSALTARLDMRHNLILVERFVPEQWRRPYREDWAQRYRAIAHNAGHPNAARRGRFEAAAWTLREATLGRQTMDDDTFEEVFQVDALTRRVIDWAQRTGAKRIAIADLAKNMYPVWRGVRHAELEPIAIADNAEAFRGVEYRGTPVLDDDWVLAQEPDGVIVSNTNPARVIERVDALRAKFGGPILTLWEPRFLKDEAAETGTTAVRPARAGAA